MDLSIYLRYYSAAGIYFSFRWGPFVHSLEIVQWDSTRRDHPGYPGRVSGSGLVISFDCYMYKILTSQTLDIKDVAFLKNMNPTSI